LNKYTVKSVLSGLFSSIYKPRRDDDGFIPLTSIVGIAPRFNEYGKNVEKLQAILSNPALLKVFCLQCDMFSLGKICVEQDEIEVPDDPIAELLNNPNPLQSRSQFLWDFMFWTMVGTSYCYVDSAIANNKENKIYFLDPTKMEFPDELVRAQDKFVFSNKTKADLLNMKIKYKFLDGSSTQMPLSKIIIITDMTNGTGNWFKGSSRIDALYKVISNTEAALDATNINTRYSGKFLVSGTQDPKDVSKVPLSTEDAQDMETKINGRKQVHAYKSMVEIKRFVEDLRKMELGKNYLESYFLIGSMYNIPRDVLEANVSSTYENQEKARASHVSYTLQPKGNDLMQQLAAYFKYDVLKKKIEIKWDHLPFMQVFEKDRALTRQAQSVTLTNLLKLGVSIEEANSFLGTNFTNAKYEQPKQNNTTQPGAAA
jgi:hypothetical protein